MCWQRKSTEEWLGRDAIVERQLLKSEAIERLVGEGAKANPRRITPLAWSMSSTSTTARLKVGGELIIAGMEDSKEGASTETELSVVSCHPAWRPVHPVAMKV